MNELATDAEQQCLTPAENAAIIAALFDVEVRERQLARQVVWLQTLAILIGASIAYSIIKGTPQVAMAVFGGGVVSVVNGAMLAWRMSRSAQQQTKDVQDPRVAHHQLRLLYFYAAERFLVVIALLGLCLAVLKLSPYALLVGFVIGQFMLLAARLLLRKIKTEIVNKNV